MWMRLIAVWAVMVVDLYFLLFYKIETHAIMLLSSQAHLTPAQEAMNARAYLIGGFGVGLLVALGICVWLNVRIVRCYRNTA
jgi:hypothetical protein